MNWKLSLTLGWLLTMSPVALRAQSTSITNNGMIVSYQSLDYPGAAYGTYCLGTDGSNVVGYYGGEIGSHGFLYNGSTFTTLDDPNAGTANGYGTFAEGIDADKIVGYYIDTNSNAHGFLYVGSTYTSLDDPDSVSGTFATGISGTNIVGFYSG